MEAVTAVVCSKEGGTDLTRETGQVKNSDIKEKKIDKETKKILKERAELIRLEGLKKKIEQAIEANPALKKIRKPTFTGYHNRWTKDSNC